MRSDRVLFALLALGLGGLFAAYRRDDTPDGKIRMAALAALGALIFLTITAAMPWVHLEGAQLAGQLPCLLGQETACANQIAADLLPAGPALSQVAAEVDRWQAASAALRMGQVTCLVLLLPALVWLLVEPQQRAAQAATALGASVAGFTMLVVLLYRSAIPSWLGATPSLAPDIALLASAAILVTAVLIVRQSFTLLSGGGGLPRAEKRRG